MAYGFIRKPAKPIIVPAGNPDEAMLEQLEYLIAHEKQDCGCAICNRYWLVRKALLVVFEP